MVHNIIAHTSTHINVDKIRPPNQYVNKKVIQRRYKPITNRTEKYPILISTKKTEKNTKKTFLSNDLAPHFHTYIPTSLLSFSQNAFVLNLLFALKSLPHFHNTHGAGTNIKLKSAITLPAQPTSRFSYMGMTNKGNIAPRRCCVTLVAEMTEVWVSCGYISWR